MADDLAQDAAYIEDCRIAAWSEWPTTETSRYWDAGERAFNFPDGWPEDVDADQHVTNALAASTSRRERAPTLRAGQSIGSPPAGDAAMKADENTLSAAERNEQHMEAVRSLHRRAAYERALNRIRFIEQQKTQACAGLREPLSAFTLDGLEHPKALRDAIHKEMKEAGQIPA